MGQHEWILWCAVVLAVAAIVHAATLREMPRFIMARSVSRMGPPNVMHFPQRPDENSRVVVRPSPDLLYSICPFNLSKGPLRVTARVPHDTYWSVAAFDPDTNNFFVRDDRQIAGDEIEIVALRPGMIPPPVGGATERIFVFAPSETGVFLFRLLINDESRLAERDAIRRLASCGTIASP